MCFLANPASAEVLEVWAEESEWKSCVSALAEQLPLNRVLTVYLPPAVLVGPEAEGIFQNDSAFRSTLVLQIDGNREERKPIVPENLRGFRLAVSGERDGTKFFISLPCLIDGRGTVRTGSETVIGLE